MRALILLCTTLIAACGAPAERQLDTSGVIDEIAERELHDGSLSGFAIVVAEHGAIVFDQGYGLRDVGTSERMTSNAVLDYFSVGKHMAAAILLRLAERESIDLDAPASTLLPGADFEGAPVTTRHLLTHSAGLSDPKIDDVNPPDYLIDAPPAGGLLKLANSSGRVAAPGETWWYSNAG